MKKFLFFLFLTVGGYVFGQTNTPLVNYKFDQSNLTPDAGAIDSPEISLVNTINFSTTYAAGNPNTGKALTTNVVTSNNYGGYIKLIINTTGYTKISISFDGYGVSSNYTFWDVFANKNGALPTFDRVSPTTDFVGTVQNNKDDWRVVSPSLLLTTDNPNFDNSPLVTIYIAAYNASNNNRILKIDNLKITGCKIPAAPTATAQTFCSGRTVADLVATGDSGNTFSWYTVASGGIALASTTALSTGTYYVSQSNNCGNSSPRTEVAVTVNPLPAAPTVSGGGTFCGSATISATGGSGETVYYQGTTSNGTSTTSGGSPQTVTASGTYYFRSQNSNGCWGPQSSVTVTKTSPLSAVASAPVPANNASGVCYQGPGAVSSVSWTAVAGAASYDVYFGAGTLPGTLTANVTTNSYNTGVLLPNTTYHWKVVPRNICGITTGTPVEWTFTTASTPCTVSYCQPTITTPGDLYINSFQFVGTLNDNPSPNTSGASGYSNFTNLTPVVQQPQGAVMNIVASALGSNDLPKSGYWKAWVDYNNDGDFVDAGEQVYSLTSFTTESLTFGFVIPSTTIVGKYRFRIRFGSNTTFDSCTNLATGETEDYIFEVVADCSAKVDTSTLVDSQRCGTGTVTLSAKSKETGTGTGIRWYAAASGGTPLFDGENFVTPSIPENTSVTYYVVAYNSTCGESVFRIPVRAIANPGPTVNFGTVASFCEATPTGKIITASNGKRTDILLNEQFNSGLGVFQQSPTESGYLNALPTHWKDRPSPYIPHTRTDTPPEPYEGLAPALSSGYTGGNFVMTNADFDRADYINRKLLNRLTLTNNLDTRFFDNLTLDFDLYYFTLITADTDPARINYFSVEYSLDETNWVNLQTIKNNQGNPNIWKKISIALPSAVLGKTTLKIRFSSFSFGESGLFKESIAAIDNVKLYGIKDESSQFSWTSTVSGILYDSTCTTALGATKAASVCVKPTATQIESNTEFSITASASFSNGCPAVGTIIVKNDAKIYNSTTSTEWSTATNWKPDQIVPDLTKCVVVQKPAVISSSTDGLAKNITIEPGGTLNINGSLKVADWVKNNAAAADVVVESDGSLVQVNEGNTINTGSITAKRVLNLSSGRQQFNYLISPLEGQSLKTIYPGMGYVLYHNEANNFFYNSSGAYIKGRALALQEPNLTAVPATTVTAVFTGYPTNGAFSYGLVNTNVTNTVSRGFNLVGNPYPSNIDLITLYSINGGASGKLSPTFSFWDNRANNQIKQMGDGYGQQAYAQFIATAPPSEGTGVLATGDTTALEGTNKPTRYVKMGQGFMVQSKVASLPLQFNNTIRTIEKGTVSFFGKGAQSTKTPIDRYWLNMITPGNQATQIAVVYFEGGNNSFGIDDAFSLGGSDAVYSIVGTEKVSINGKNSFVTTDFVPLGTTHFVAGNYTFALHDKEGVFASGQPIYLKDKQTGIITNLSEGQYAFTANVGESTGRFEIVYQSETVLATDDGVKEEIQVYRDGNYFVVKASTKKITELQMYDASGKLIKQLQPDSKEISIDLGFLNNGVYFLKIIQGDLVSVKKIIK